MRKEYFKEIFNKYEYSEFCNVLKIIKSEKHGLSYETFDDDGNKIVYEFGTKNGINYVMTYLFIYELVVKHLLKGEDDLAGDYAIMLKKMDRFLLANLYGPDRSNFLELKKYN